MPTFEETADQVLVTLHLKVGTTTVTTAQDAMQVTTQVAAVLEAARTPRPGGELQEVASIRNRDHFRKAHLLSLFGAGWIARTISERPKSRLQRCRATEAGLRVLAERRHT